MIKQFISQNVGYRSRINHSYFYFLGPNHIDPTLISNETSETNPLDTINVLFGMSFDYPLKKDEQGRYFKICASLVCSYGGDNGLYRVNIYPTVTDASIDIDGEHKFFVIPLDIPRELVNLHSIEFSDATIEIYNPDPKYIYTAPTSFSTGWEYIAVTTDVYMNNEELNSYEGTFEVDLFNPNTENTALYQDLLSLSFGKEDITTQSFYTSWVKRSDLNSDNIYMKFSLTCSNQGGMSSGKSLDVNYAMEYYGINDKISEGNAGYEHIEIPTTIGGTASTSISDTLKIYSIPEKCDYIIFNINTTLPTMQNTLI